MSDQPLQDVVRRLNAANKEIARLRAAIRETLSDNRHLADGENCTLLKLKRAMSPIARISDGREQGQPFMSAKKPTAQPWIAEPTRAGWWVAGRGEMRVLHYVQWMWIFAPTECDWCYETASRERKKCSDMAGWRWSGPVEFPALPNAETPPNDQAHRLEPAQPSMNEGGERG